MWWGIRFTRWRVEVPYAEGSREMGVLEWVVRLSAQCRELWRTLHNQRWLLATGGHNEVVGHGFRVSMNLRPQKSSRITARSTRGIMGKLCYAQLYMAYSGLTLTVPGNFAVEIVMKFRAWGNVDASFLGPGLKSRWLPGENIHSWSNQVESLSWEISKRHGKR